MDFDESDQLPLMFLAGVLFAGIIKIDINLILASLGSYIFYYLYVWVRKRLKKNG